MSDKDGRTPLSWAAENGSEEIVLMLLGREDITPDTGDEWAGRTAQVDASTITSPKEHSSRVFIAGTF